MDVGDVVELTAERMVAGGVALAHAADGRVALVDGALPDERVAARVTRVRRDLVHASVVDIHDASRSRVRPPCPFVAAGCGGCDWQHIETSAQATLKRDIVVDALARLGGIRDARVDAAIALAPFGYRTALRALVTDDGRVALRRRASHEPIAVDDCLVAHPLVAAVVRTQRFPGAREVTIRAGARTGERLVVVDDVASAPQYHERVGDTTLRVSARSFFQPHADAPETLTRLVHTHLGAPRTLADLYCGVGLFSATSAAERVVAVDSSRAAIRDARHNLRGRDGTAEVRVGDVARQRLARVDAVVADPARAGLGPRAVAVITSAQPRDVVLISCDAAALGRDARLLHAQGYELVRCTPVDQLPGTSHVEVVSAFTR
jgi:23S rRNA (uracil1939-C5)-methyltransferase